MLCQTEHELRAMKRTCHANRIYGVDTVMISPARMKEMIPIINIKVQDTQYLVDYGSLVEVQQDMMQ